MSNIIIIPARYSATRFPGKLLVDLGGVSVLKRVIEQCSKTKTQAEIIVATDDERIKSHLSDSTVKVVMTGTHHKSGTDRCAEIIKEKDQYDYVVNVQGDEPFINPMLIDQVFDTLKTGNTEIVTAKKCITDPAIIKDPARVKVVTNKKNEALYFSRSVIPFKRNVSNVSYFKHIGIYGFKASILSAISELPLSELEKTESLEQLRWLENGYTIKLVETEYDAISIDTPEDLEKAKAYL